MTPLPASERSHGQALLIPELETVAGWAARFQGLYPGARSDGTERHNAQMLAPFVREHGDRALADVTTIDALEWARKHPGHVRYLRLMFGRAVKAQLIDRDPFQAVEAPAAQSTANHPPSLEELDQLVAAAGELWLPAYAQLVQDMMLVTAYTGLRLMELAVLEPGDVLAADRLFVRDGKGGKERLLGVYGDGPAALDRRLAAPVKVFTPDGWRERLFVSPASRPLNKHSVGRVLATVCAKAGLSITFHSLRHFCATWLIDQGAEELDVALQLGHVDKAGRAYPELVRRVYAHPAVEPALQRLQDTTTTRRSET